MHVRAPAGSTARRSRCRCRSPATAVTLVDVGANVEARPDHLVQFGFMGAALARTVPRRRAAADRAALQTARSRPRARPTSSEVHALLRERLADHSQIEWVGNIEGTDLTTGVADVVVTDGFTGNVALKLIEGVSQTVVGRDPPGRDVEPDGRCSAGCC